MNPLGASPLSEERGFDRVTAGGEDGRAPSTWTRTQFQQLSLIDRVRLLAGGELRFYKDSREVPAREALRDL